MSKTVWKKGRIALAGLFAVVALISLAMWGCGTSGYDSPSTTAATTQTATALIDAGTLKQWVDAGLVNKAGGYDRVVILDVSANASDGSNAYNTVGHIPGAQLISGGSNAFQETRAEGPLSATGSMVCSGATIDSLIQNAGIDKYTTIVLTTNATGASGAINMCRAYATFRYWGFPKNRLKVLDGGNYAWTATTDKDGNAKPKYDLTAIVPTIQKSTYGVAQNGTTNVNPGMRVSLSEMIAYVNDIVAGNAGKVTIIDTVRGSTTTVNATVSGPTSDLIDTTKFTPFDGAMKGSYSYHATRMLNGNYFKTADQLKADLSAAFGTDGSTALGDANRDATKTFITLCRAGNYASVGFFALDGIAYYNTTAVNVEWYDGSYGQWNLMASLSQTAPDGITNAGGKLKDGSIWNTTSLMDNLTWNIAPPRSKTIIDYTSRVLGVEPSYADGNQLENADRAYRSTVTGPTGGGATGGGGC